MKSPPKMAPTTTSSQSASGDAAQAPLVDFRVRALGTGLLVCGWFMALGMCFRIVDYLREGAWIHILGASCFLAVSLAYFGLRRLLHKGRFSLAAQSFFVVSLLFIITMRLQRLWQIRIDVPVTLFATFVVLCILSAMLLPRRTAFLWCFVYACTYATFHALPFWWVPSLPGNPNSKVIVTVVPALVLFLLTWLSQWSTTNILQALERSEQNREAVEEANAQLQQTNVALEEARHAAQAANHAKSQFLGNISHELRTPLNAIIGYSEMIEEELVEREGEDAMLQQDIGYVLSSSRHLLGLIEDLLDLTKIEEGKLELRPEELALADFVVDVAASVEPLCARQENGFSVEVAPELTTWTVDGSRLRQCLLNLLDNAAKFTHEGQIRLRVFVDEGVQALEGMHTEAGGPQGEEAGAFLNFAVTDTGIGMDEEQIAQCFAPFWQADATMQRRYNGSGLGLALTRELCTQLGGSLYVQSTPGEGSTFTMRFPHEA